MTEPTPKRIPNVSVATIAGAAGCFMIVIVVGALILGIALDRALGWRGPFTIGLVVISAPLSLYLVYRMVIKVLREMQQPPQDQQDSD
jgi:membrane protein implicated in regulation of membrane protease activity